MKDIDWIAEIRKALLSMVWFLFLLFPLMVMKVSVHTGVSSVIYRWENIIWIMPAAFALSLLWSIAIQRKQIREASKSSEDSSSSWPAKVRAVLAQRKYKVPLMIAFVVIVAGYPHAMGFYHTNVMISALIYIMLGLGLNIIVGLGGLLQLGQVAFFAVGAYTYALVFKYMGEALTSVGFNLEFLFWICLPLAAVAVMISALMLAIPVLRLRGDYLAIVTLAFSEIVRMILQNETQVTNGAGGISRIPRPWIFGIQMDTKTAALYIYYIVALFVVLSVFIVKRLEDSRLGRSWEAMREDEIACQSMGISLLKQKALTFIIGAVWAGLAGVIFGAQTTYINPGSFTIWESVMILMAVVIGGTGSIPGVILGALLLKLLPEYFRFLSEYRMLLFGIMMVLIIIFKPDGLIPRMRKKHVVKTPDVEGA